MLEVISLLFIISACFCVSPFVSRLLRIIVSNPNNSGRVGDAAKHLRLRLFLTFIALVVSFVLRASRSVIVAYGASPPSSPSLPMYSFDPSVLAFINYKYNNSPECGGAFPAGAQFLQVMMVVVVLMMMIMMMIIVIMMMTMKRLQRTDTLR